MELNIVQGMVQQQKFILTTEMRQSLKILQMPLFEVQQHITRELAENPLLEITPLESIPDEQIVTVKDDALSRVIQAQEILGEELEPFSRDFQERNDPLDFISAKLTLKDYLFEQALDLNEAEPVIAICDYIIESIDERGYLSCKAEEIAAELKVPIDEVNYALALVQEFQPWGVAAGDLKECLKIQLRKKQVRDEHVYLMVEECLELIAENKIKEIAKRLDLEVEKVQEHCRLIKSLEPKPARGFYTGAPENFIIPEAYIIKSGNDLFVLMNESALPRLTINKLYKDIIKKEEDKQALGFVKDKLNKAIFLINEIEHRKRTIYKIIERIIELQKDYFMIGEDCLKPMTYSDIAGSLNLHESTISRAVQDKYICTPFNTIMLKDLFSGGIASGGTGERVSSKLVKKEIRRLIDNEDKIRPLSDQDICDKLKGIQIELSRRTVAKYRNEMGIGSSGRRKVYYHE